MKFTRWFILCGASEVLLIAAWFVVNEVAPTLALSLPSKLPRLVYPDGGEFRVVQVRFIDGPSESSDHAIGHVPRISIWAWRQLPKTLQSRIDFPSSGISYNGSYGPALSVWWTYIHPGTGKPEIGPTSSVVTTLDSGRQLDPIWPSPTDEGYRQIFLVDPPRHSKRLRFQFDAEEGHPVDITIKNPAYLK